jgi:RNA polymerase sigma factor (TIGR02999 family)
LSKQFMAEPAPSEITGLLLSWSGGDRTALDRLIPLVYRELRRLAAAYLRRERTGHTLQTTALVHEAYLRLIDQNQVTIPSRSQFFAIAANLMRQILVNHAERHNAAKRGGGNKVALDEVADLIGQPTIDMLALNNALNKLAELDLRQSRIVELRFFGGLNVADIAGLLEVSPTTVKREWRSAKAMLYSELRLGGLG